MVTQVFAGKCLLLFIKSLWASQGEQQPQVRHSFQGPLPQHSGRGEEGQCLPRAEKQPGPPTTARDLRSICSPGDLFPPPYPSTAVSQTSCMGHKSPLASRLFSSLLAQPQQLGNIKMHQGNSLPIRNSTSALL